MDITAIVQQAKEMLLHYKNHPPVIFVEFQTGKGAVLPFAGFPTADDGSQPAVLFAAGCALARQKELRGEAIRHLCFVSKGWQTTTNPEEAPPSYRPSEDESRVEVLAVQTLDVQSSEGKPPYMQAARLIEVLRDGAGDLVDLLPREQEYAIESGLLEYFIAGFAQAARKASKAEAGKKHKHKAKEGKAGKKKHG